MRMEVSLMRAVQNAETEHFKQNGLKQVDDTV